MIFQPAKINRRLDRRRRTSGDPKRRLLYQDVKLHVHDDGGRGGALGHRRLSNGNREVKVRISEERRSHDAARFARAGNLPATGSVARFWIRLDMVQPRIRRSTTDAGERVSQCSERRVHVQSYRVNRHEHLGADNRLLSGRRRSSGRKKITRRAGGAKNLTDHFRRGLRQGHAHKGGCNNNFLGLRRPTREHATNLETLRVHVRRTDDRRSAAAAEHSDSEQPCKLNGNVTFAPTKMRTTSRLSLMLGFSFNNNSPVIHIPQSQRRIGRGLPPRASRRNVTARPAHAPRPLRA
ncbi:hypothetical protein EVAR_31526_1 [Eumeta japonica]|uniref:Uncharacterized protein n=1 Tax=Eumeta variegata TaxID=151549 RepID=A0A4C1Z2E0_EUMVA|nr:hypothetical protein EVAR_31526_1 [Eumeta japonica]